MLLLIWIENKDIWYNADQNPGTTLPKKKYYEKN